MADVLVVLFVALLSAGVFLFVVHPLRDALRFSEEEKAPVDRLADLYARRDTLYQAIKDLEFDYQVGKVVEADYRHLRERLRQEAAAVLREIDALQARQADVRERLEAEVRALREHLATATQASPQTDTETAQAEATTSYVTPRFCTQCGAALRPGDRFCSQCGAAVVRVQEPAVR